MSESEFLGSYLSLSVVVVMFLSPRSAHPHTSIFAIYVSFPFHGRLASCPSFEILNLADAALQSLLCSISSLASQA